MIKTKGLLGLHAVEFSNHRLRAFVLEESYLVITESEKIMAIPVMADTSGKLHAQEIPVEPDGLFDVVGDERQVVYSRETHVIFSFALVRVMC
jgi:hypothetical protein